MPSTRDLVHALKAELKAAGLTYAELGAQLGLAESSIKRMFSHGDMPLSRIDDVLRVIGLDFADLAARVVEAQPQRRELTVEQEQAVLADRLLLLVAICCLSQWTLEQVLATYALSEPEAVQRLAQLDRLGIIELKPHNRYRLRVSKTLRWRPDGPVMRYFREQVVGDFFAGDFGGDGEQLMLVHGQIGPGAAAAFNERLSRVVEDFAQQHRADQRLPAAQKRPYTLVIAMRSWWFSLFRDLRRPGAPQLPG
jgi:hypothetical protein